ncbi:unnamed protein product [Mytilus coruscus]|uniref:DZIP3-like HEPN domain-containing protein n=1 Tax=Mytilus coruscus TaxID=42192 RepID=A0A6J8BPB4_MYTCO|nr:unnamed protein product [Mytilus coruscus]
MLSRIQFISNETLRNFEGQLSGYKFNKNWDCIGQAVLKLASSFKLDTKNDEEKTRLIDRLLVLNRKNIDTRSLHSIYYRFIPEQQWKLLYSKLEGGYSHTCQSGGKPCIERFVPKMMTTWNVSVSKTLILNIPDILTYMISRLNISEFDQFLLHYQHVLYHSMEGKMCCKCQKVPSNKIIIDEEEWNILFKKENDMSCHHGIKNCCCQYSVRNGINFTDIEGIYLSKIFTVAGPIGELNKIEQDALLYFLHWTRDDKPLQKALLDLSNMIDDKFCCINISSLIPNQSTETKLKQLEAHGWIDSHLPKQKATTEPQLQILIRDEDGLNARSVLIPDDFSLPCRTTKFKDLTTEENNYLVVVYGLTKIVYPVIRNEFKSQCPSHVLEEIRFSIFDKVMNANNSRDAKNGAIDKIHNTPDLQDQLSPRPKLKNPDFELMITILKIRSNTDWNKRYIDNLDVIENIRREIIQSNSGILDQTRFHNILNRISKAVLYLGGEKFKDELSRLHHIRNILE